MSNNWWEDPNQFNNANWQSDHNLTLQDPSQAAAYLQNRYGIQNASPSQINTAMQRYAPMQTPQASHQLDTRGQRLTPQNRTYHTDIDAKDGFGNKVFGDNHDLHGLMNGNLSLDSYSANHPMRHQYAAMTGTPLQVGTNAPIPKLDTNAGNWLGGTQDQTYTPPVFGIPPPGGPGGSSSPQPPAYLAPPSTNPETYAGSGIGPMEGSVLTRDHLNYLMSQDSPYMQHADFKGRATANARGLLDSSLAAGHAQRAAIEAALPIAQDDAAFFKNLGLTRDEYQQRTGLQEHEWDNRHQQSQTDWMWKGVFQDHESDTARWSKFMDGLININMQDMDPVQKQKALDNFRADMQNSAVRPLLDRVIINPDDSVTFNPPPSGGTPPAPPPGEPGQPSQPTLPSAQELGIENLVTEDRSVSDVVSTVKSTFSWVRHNINDQSIFDDTPRQYRTPAYGYDDDGNPLFKTGIDPRRIALDNSILKDKAHRDAYNKLILDRLKNQNMEMTPAQIRKIAEYLT